jgi:alpha-tubulin suppressor-like RCC1 family protein
VSRLRILLSAVALFGAPGCNLIFGLDEPTLEGAGGDTNTGAGSIGGAGAGAGEGGFGAAMSDGGGGAGPVCPSACPADCFENACDGQTPVELAPGSQASCVRLKSGSVWCFGSNRHGALGRPPNEAPNTCTTSSFGDTVPCSYEALRVDLPAKALSLGVGYHAACAVLATNEAWCWGANDRGLLGHVPDESDETCDGIACRTAPTKVQGLPPAASVVVGDTHACAVVEGGAWCWGLNQAGQLGNGEVIPADLALAIDPEQVTPPGPVDAKFAGDTVYKLAISGDHSCAADSAKKLWCWGANTFGQVGPVDGVDCGLCAEPTPVASESITLTNGLQLAAARGATCFIEDQTSIVRCRGWNGWEFLNKSWEQEVHEDALDVGGTEGASSLSASDTHVCVIAAGEVSCWGTDFAGQLGDGTVDGEAGTECAYGIRCDGIPTPVADVEATQIRTGNLITMALRADGSVVGWGINQTALLGYEPDTGTDQMCAYYDATLDDVLCTATPSLVSGLPD